MRLLKNCFVFLDLSPINSTNGQCLFNNNNHTHKMGGNWVSSKLKKVLEFMSIHYCFFLYVNWLWGPYDGLHHLSTILLFFSWVPIHYKAKIWGELTNVKLTMKRKKALFQFFWDINWHKNVLEFMSIHYWLVDKSF